MRAFSVGGMTGEELREEMLVICADLARCEKPPRGAAVNLAAARVVLDNIPNEDPLDELVRLLGGDSQRALEWMRLAIARLEARCAAAQGETPAPALCSPNTR